MSSLELVARRLRGSGCVFAEDEAALLLDAASGEALDRLVERRCLGEPLEHVLGWVELDGRRLSVGPGVFVPRRRTRLLARLSREAASQVGGPVVELCCGVAPVAALLGVPGPGRDVHVADLDPLALEHAARNVPHASVHRGDLFAALPPSLRGRVGVLAANAPYVPTRRIADMPPEARDHEPLVTLDGGADGVDVHRRIAGEVRDWLAPGGVVLVETSRGQAGLSCDVFGAAGLDARVHEDDDLDATVVTAVSPGPRG